MTGTYKKFHAGRITDWLNIQGSSSISGQSWFTYSTDGTKVTSFYNGTAMQGINNPSNGTAYASTDDINTYNKDKYALTGTGLSTSFNKTTCMQCIENEGYLNYVFTVTGGAEDTVIKSIYFTGKVYINSNTQKVFLLGAIYLDTPVTVLAGQSVNIPVLLKVE
jgi:hypothetical protein